MLLAGGINVPNTSGGNCRAHSDFVLASRPHFEAHQAIAYCELVGRRVDQTKVNSWFAS